MDTTQAFRNALHIPFSDPEAGMVVTTFSAGDKYVTDWAAGAAGIGFSEPQPGQTSSW